ncbi:universal stress protein [Streptomyces sp. NPDC050564]|uniref:universal stress protein n=1 Tax=Streptomyces sp. NPDC050564 TaxID=3365631 RepID=UPI00379CB037
MPGVHEDLVTGEVIVHGPPLADPGDLAQLQHFDDGEVAVVVPGNTLVDFGPRDENPRLINTADEHLAGASADQLLAEAEQRLGRPCTRIERTGRVEREVVAAEGADLLILARDGDRSHLGPRSLGPASRFIVDHAPCPVLLVWPEHAPGIAPIPPPPPHPPHHR